MRKMAILILVFMAGCGSGRWAWEMTEAEKEMEWLESRHVQRAPSPKTYGLLHMIGEILRGVTERN